MTFWKRHSATLSLLVFTLVLFGWLGYVAYQFGWRRLLPPMNSPVERFTVILVVVALYFIPSLLAFERKHAKRLHIVATNLFLGWTVIGWFGALLWAARSKASA